MPGGTEVAPGVRTDDTRPPGLTSDERRPTVSTTSGHTKKPERPIVLRVETAAHDVVADMVLPSETFRRTVVGWLSLVGVILAGTFVPLVFLTSLSSASTVSGKLWLVVLMLCYGGAFVRRAHRDADVLAFIGAVAAANAAVPALERVGGGPMTTLLLIIMTWISVLVRPVWVAGVSLYVLLLLQVFGVEWVPTVAQMTRPTQMAAPVVGVVLALPVAFAAAIHHVLRQVDDTTLGQIEKARTDRRRIAEELEARLVELDASRDQLMHAQKLQTVGTMASGLAHELNNILTPIRGLSELLVVGVGAEQARRYGQRILDAAVAAAQITGSLLAYTRQGTFAPVRSDLGELLERQILPVLGQTLPSNVRLETNFTGKVSADVDRVLFQQAITNLVLNAVDAMPNGGTLRLELHRHADRIDPRTPQTLEVSATRLPSPDDPARSSRLAAVPSTGGDVEYFARIDVKDTGTGIPPEHLGRIFDPFFTTKRVGSGQGLGLPAVQGIVERHGGRIEVVSVVGEGSTFSVFLPLPELVDEGSSPAWPALKRKEGAAVVLIVSEDADTRDELEDLVSAMPCAPITADDPKAARSLLTELGDRVDLLVLDFDLQSADPAPLLRTVRGMNPTLPIVLLMLDPTRSGMEGVGDATTAPGARGLVRVLRKPIDQRLAQALITDVLNVEGHRPRRATPTS